MKILVSGATGFIGSAVAAHLESLGHTVVRLSRRAGENTVVWEPDAGRIGSLPDDLDAVVHLAGENIFGLWTTRKKERIYASRVKGTTLLAEHLAAMRVRPGVFVCASAVGYYGDGGETVLTEQSPAGSGFLSRVCREWEAATQPAQAAGVRVVNLRLGMVLDRRGGALAKMLPAFKMGLGGVLGSGRQWGRWIALADAVRVIAFALTAETPCGPVNAVAPEPVTNRTFTKTLAETLHRPAILPAPAAVLRLLPGKFADETLLSSTRALPEKLLNSGFSFNHSTLREALAALLTP